MPGMPAGGTTNMTIDAKWLGACKSDQRPGDIIMANGMKMNIADMQKMQGMQGGRPGCRARSGVRPARQVAGACHPAAGIHGPVSGWPNGERREPCFDLSAGTPSAAGMSSETTVIPT